MPKKKPAVPNGALGTADRSADHRRYIRFTEGESAEAIAAADGISEEKALKSIEHGSLIQRYRSQDELMRLKTQAAIDNEKLRKKVRDASGAKILEAIEALLNGTRVVVEKGEDGRVSFREFKDPEVLAMGLDQFRKTVSLEERPAPAVAITSVSQTNIQNNNGGGDGAAWDFETTLAQIREKQRALAPVDDAIDVEAVVVGAVVDAVPYEVQSAAASFEKAEGVDEF